MIRVHCDDHFCARPASKVCVLEARTRADPCGGTGLRTGVIDAMAAADVLAA
jgi:hypothetical protein